MSESLPTDPRRRVVVVGLGSALSCTLGAALASIASQRQVDLEFSDKIDPNSKDIQVKIEGTEYVAGQFTQALNRKLPDDVITHVIKAMEPVKYHYIETKRDAEHPFEKFLKKKKRFS